LRQADIGVAMGRGGTEVARDAADIVLTDDNFASIEAAVEEGRCVYDNLMKFITWTLPTNLGEGLIILVAVLVGATLPVLPVQILWINMTTAVLLGLMLAFEPPEGSIMARPPRDPHSRLLSGALMTRIAFVGVLLLAGSFALFDYAQSQGESDEFARTVAVNVFVFVEMLYLFNCRTHRESPFAIGLFSNRWVLVGVASMIVLQMLFTYAPPMQALFGSESIGLDYWTLILGWSLVAFVLVEIEKRVRMRMESRWPSWRLS
jgi:Ca2+-transporting ATPase